MSLISKNILAILLSILFSFLLFISVDITYSFFFLKKNEPSDSVYSEKDSGWYELKRNYLGSERWGNHQYLVSTDSNGMRKSPAAKESINPKFIFLGDSFVYGINGPWEETFVGMLSNISPDLINAGVSSYSPTAYLFQYERIIKSRQSNFPHTVVVGIDISDVQDESSFWIDGNQHPEKSKEEQILKATHHNTSTTTQVSYREWIISHLPLTTKLYRLFTFKTPKINNYELIRSGFTWMEWDELDQHPGYINFSGYAPLGVKGGLNKIEKKLIKLVWHAKKNGAQVYFLIYPWPAQLTHNEVFSWPNFIKGVCETAQCAGVIDTFPIFKQYSKENKNWYESLYVKGDVHFNENGNKLIYNALKDKFLH